MEKPDENAHLRAQIESLTTENKKLCEQIQNTPTIFYVKPFYIRADSVEVIEESLGDGTSGRCNVNSIYKNIPISAYKLASEIGKIKPIKEEFATEQTEPNNNTGSPTAPLLPQDKPRPRRYGF